MVISQADLDLHYFVCPQVCPRMPLRSTTMTLKKSLQVILRFLLS